MPRLSLLATGFLLLGGPAFAAPGDTTAPQATPSTPASPAANQTPATPENPLGQ